RGLESMSNFAQPSESPVSKPALSFAELFSSFVPLPSSLRVNRCDSRRAADRMRIHEHLQTKNFLEQIDRQNVARRTHGDQSRVFQEHHARRELSREIYVVRHNDGGGF